MLLAFLTLGQWLILLVLALVLGLLAIPATRRYTKLLLGSARTAMSCVILCVTLAMSSIPIYGDLHYLVSGHEAEATITKIESARKSRHVVYRFTEADGTQQTGTDAVGTGWIAPTDGKVTVQYIPGEAGHSRLSRYMVHWFPYVLFAISACLLFTVIVMSVRRVMRAAPGPL